MSYLYTKSKHYKLFIEKNGSNRLSKGLKISTIDDKLNLLKFSSGYQSKNEEEIFDSPIKTEYKIFTINSNFINVKFKSNSNTEYRIDLHRIFEHDDYVNHISFTENRNDYNYDSLPLDDRDFDEYNINYNEKTNKMEMIEILNRMRYILKDLINNKSISNSFCIGGSEIMEKNKIYEYFLKIVIGESGFSKKETNVYPKTNWGLYFSV